MSVRENIAANLVTSLQAITSPITVKYVTREPFEFDKLSNAQYPAILVRTTNENREDATVGGSISQRFGVIDYQLVCYVKGTGLDSARNNIVEAVEEKLDVDRSRGGYALDTQLITVETDDGSIAPIGGVILTVRCEYQYTRGTT
jgi:hypothetical protein|tara:strand:+ start:325 stop:759 length:435 start_codon:yes stop_codon:yes gene_type:complete